VNLFSRFRFIFRDTIAWYLIFSILISPGHVFAQSSEAAESSDAIVPVISESVPSADSSASASSEISAPTEDATPPASEDAPPSESAMSAMSGGSGSVFGGADGSPSTIKNLLMQLQAQ
jgi:hypothetical protein